MLFAIVVVGVCSSLYQAWVKYIEYLYLVVFIFFSVFVFVFVFEC